MRNIVLFLCITSLLFVGCGRRKQPEEETVSQLPEPAAVEEQVETTEEIEEPQVTPEPTPEPTPVAEPLPIGKPVPRAVSSQNNYGEQVTLFWNEFRGAVVNDDRLRVFELTRFPLPVDGIPDIDYTQIGRTRLGENYDRIFNPEVRQKIAATTRPERYTRFDGTLGYRLTTTYYGKDGTESLVILEFEDENGQYRLSRVSG